jgi:hypothetical protein
MPNSKTRRVLNVFLASPNDVLEERTTAEEVVIELNKIVARQLAWQVDLHKWEDTSPGYGRPQAKINAAVDNCQLFIGLLWERWGQPTGDYSSGFEEEYERARGRRKTSNEPEIWLAFKALDPERLKDPGPQLSKVLEFRRTQAGLGEVLFKDVKDNSDWRSKLQHWLMEYVLTLALPSLMLAEQESPSATPSPQFAEATAETKMLGERDQAETAEQSQLAQLSETLSDVIQTEDLEFSPADENKFQKFEVARLYLLSATWMSSRYTADVLGTHEINLLYRYREKLRPTPRERFELLRAALSDASDAKPCWFWYQDLSAEDVEMMLLYVGKRDNNPDLRAKALRLLKSAQIVLPNEKWPELPLSDDIATVRVAAYQYLASLANQDALELLHSIEAKLENASFSRAAHKYALEIQLHLNPDEGLLELITQPELVSDELLSTLSTIAPKIGTEPLLTAAGDPVESIRTICIEELARRRELPRTLAQSLTDDKSATVRALAFTRLAELGAPIDLVNLNNAVSRFDADLIKKGIDAGSIVLRVFRTYPTQQLLELVDWYSLNGQDAYCCLALERFEEISAHIRTDIENGFSRIKAESDARLRLSSGTVADLIVQKFEKEDLNKYVASRFLEAAMVGLAAHSEPSDINFGRKYLLPDEPRLSRAALDIVSRFGDASDVKALLVLAKEGFQSIATHAAAAALKLSPEPNEVARELTMGPHSEVKAIAFRWLLDNPSEQAKALCRELLDGQDATNRVRSTYCLSQMLNRDELEQLLKDYLARETYFYSVVTWLDRLLYSPSPVRKVFHQKLEQVLYSK